MVVVLGSDIFGKNLRYLRQRAGMDVEILSTILNITVDEIEKLEAGEQLEIKYEVLRRMKEYFGFDSMALMDVDLEHVGEAGVEVTVIGF